VLELTRATTQLLADQNKNQFMADPPQPNMPMVSNDFF